MNHPITKIRSKHLSFYRMFDSKADTTSDFVASFFNFMIQIYQILFQFQLKMKLVSGIPLMLPSLIISTKKIFQQVHTLLLHKDEQNKDSRRFWATQRTENPLARLLLFRYALEPLKFRYQAFVSLYADDDQ